MDVSKFRDGRVHVRKSGKKWLQVDTEASLDATKVKEL